MKKLFFIVALIIIYLLVSIGQIKAQYVLPDSSCLKMYCPNDYSTITDTGSYNPDSVRVDTCENSSTYGKKFANRYFIIQLKPYYYPFDTLLKQSDNKLVSDINNNCSALKYQFENLELIYGTIYFHGLYELSDSSSLSNPLLFISFENYQNIELITNVLKSLDSVLFASYEMRAGYPTTVPNDKDYSSNKILLYPNPATDYLYISLPSVFPHGKIEIFSIEGIKIMETEDVSRIDVRDLCPGVYFVKIGGKVAKFVKM